MLETVSDDEIIMCDELNSDPIFMYIFSKEIEKSYCWYGERGDLIIINLYQLVDTTKKYIIDADISSIFLHYVTVHELCHWATDEEEVEGEWLKALAKALN